jgi:hypothetical protein
MRCPPEIVMERPHVTNNFRWCWMICQPDANWAEIRAGSSEGRQRAEQEAMTALAIETRIWENEQ